jgi:hypothetical protein
VGLRTVQKSRRRRERNGRKFMAAPVPNTFAQPRGFVRGPGAALEVWEGYFFLASLAFFFSFGLRAGCFLVSLAPLSLLAM